MPRFTVIIDTPVYYYTRLVQRSIDVSGYLEFVQNLAKLSNKETGELSSYLEPTARRVTAAL
ncbi:MAG: hypothetical protein ACLUOI_20235 [Eisenbergiella sp.]